MRFPNPYALLAGFLLVCSILGGSYLFGRSDGREAQRIDDAALIARKDAALRESALAHGQASVRFREIGALTAVAEAEARAQSKLAAELARTAGKDRTELAKRIAAMNAAAERERTTCSESEIRICGLPLL